MKTKTIAIAAGCAVLLGGCSFAPEVKVPTPELPERVVSDATTSSVDAAWWQRYDDPVLSGLIDEALHNSDDLKVSVAKLAEAEALLGLSESNRYPTLDAGASAGRQKTSGETLSPFGGIAYSTYKLSANAAYEIDLWGRLKNLRESAYAQYRASAADRDTVRLSLICGVAEAYINLISINRQIVLIEEKKELYAEEYDYRKRQAQFGEIDPLIVEQARSLYANADVSLEGLVESRRLAQNALAMLIGRSPKAMGEEGFAIRTGFPNLLPIPTILPSEVLNRRPDIRSAEEMLRASNANIGAVKASYFPSISLTGNVGLESTQLGHLMQNSASFWGIGPSLTLPVLDFGRIDNQVKNAEAQREGYSLTYAKTVKNAFKEVYDSLHKIDASKRKIAAQEEALDAYRKVSDLARIRYESGYVDYLNLADARVNLLNAQQNAILLDAEMFINQITLYKALGGGWKGD
ncbi:MAG: efflux transporter outer membrane subunit [Sulfuricurvum sp.]